MFKKPKKKDATALLSKVVSFEAGKRISRGLVGLNLSTNANHARGGILAVTLIAAASYAGKNKDLVQSALIGAALEQGGRMVDDYAASAISTKPDVDAGTKFLYDMIGLNGEMRMLQGNTPGMALPSASLVHVDYTEDAEVVSTTFTGV